MSLLWKLQLRIMQWSRTKKLSHFYSLRKPGTSVLDVGVSCHDYSDQVNVFLKSFRDDPMLYTGLAVQDISDIAAKYHDRKFFRYDGTVFPFEDQKFDWVFSNAVIEHVGNREAQIHFIQEMKRVARKVFFTTPNKYFPVESHTNAILRHWHSSSFYSWCEKKGLYWNEENLYLMSHDYLLRLLDDSGIENYSLSTNRILGWPMTFTVVIGGAD